MVQVYSQLFFLLMNYRTLCGCLCFPGNFLSQSNRGENESHLRQKVSDTKGQLFTLIFCRFQINIFSLIIVDVHKKLRDF